MSDLALDWDPAAAASTLLFDGADPAVDGGLRSAVIVSLFSDRRASPDDIAAAGWPADEDPRGFWADSVAPERPRDLTGSRLWLLARAPNSEETLHRAEDYVREALAWMIEDGLADRVEARAERFQPDGLGIKVSIARPQGDRRFEFIWGRG